MENRVLEIFKNDDELSASQVHSFFIDVSLVTVRRYLVELSKKEFLEVVGKGRSLKYKLSKQGVLLRPFSWFDYKNLNEKFRNAKIAFNFEIFEKLDIAIFTQKELEDLEKATEVYKKNQLEGSNTIHKKELERFIIELSWKSSKIEGNTYSLLDTELLLKEGLKSNKNTESETRMILNHKIAFDFILKNKGTYKNLTLEKIIKVHSLLTEDLGIQHGFRNFPVGISGTLYRPLEKEAQILDALGRAISVINKIVNPYQKALLTILLISYIQPFEDGNKRTSRLVGNAILLANDIAPLSYRTVEEDEYKICSMIFYEQNSIEAFKQIFIEQYIFACNNYNLG